MRGGGGGGGGISLVGKNDKKHPLCKTTIPPYHPLCIINFVYYVKRIMHMKCYNSLLMIISELNNGKWLKRNFWSFLRQQKVWFFLE